MESNSRVVMEPSHPPQRRADLEWKEGTVVALRHAATRALLPCCFVVRTAPDAKPGVLRLERTDAKAKFLQARVEGEEAGRADCEGKGTETTCKFYAMEVELDDLAVREVPVMRHGPKLDSEKSDASSKQARLVAFCNVAMVSLDETGAKGKGSEKKWFLGMNEAGELRANLPLSKDSLWVVEPQPPNTRRPTTTNFNPAYYPDLQLGLDNIDSFVKNGYLHVKRAVDSRLVQEALRAINYHLGQLKAKGGKPDPGPGFGLASQDVHVLDLLHQSSVWTLAHRLVGVGKVQTKSQAQCALRFPEPGSSMNRVDVGQLPWHVDGANVHKRSPFTFLLGICLSEQMQENIGNLCVYPGSHIQCYQALHAANEVDPGQPPRENVWQGRRPKMQSGPRQLLLQPGDAVFIHSKLAHTVAPNYSPNIRYQVYFRVFHVNHDPSKVTLWEEFEGVQSALEEMSVG